MNEPWGGPVSSITNAERAIYQLSDLSNFPGRIPVLEHVLALRPDLSTVHVSGLNLLGDTIKLKMLFAHGYGPILKNFILYHRVRLEEDAHPIFVRTAFEGGVLCPSYAQCREMASQWIWHIYEEVQRCRAYCIRAIIALGGIRRRRKGMRDILSLIMPLVWSTRYNDKWLHNL